MKALNTRIFFSSETSNEMIVFHRKVCFFIYNLVPYVNLATLLYVCFWETFKQGARISTLRTQYSWTLTSYLIHFTLHYDWEWHNGFIEVNIVRWENAICEVMVDYLSDMVHCQSRKGSKVWEVWNIGRI